MTTNIQWTEDTWNPLAGCEIVSPGCKNCYAMRDAHRLAHNPNPKVAAKYAGTTKLVKGKPVWTGKIGIAADTAFLKPLRIRKPTMFFVNSMSDLFHENVPDEVIDRIFAIMALCPQHTFQVLTKRSARMREYVTTAQVPARLTEIIRGAGHAADMNSIHVEACADALHYEGETGEWPLSNIWLGVSVEDQVRADERIPDLLATPAAIRFISAEPLLGNVDVTPYLFVYTYEDDRLLGAASASDFPELPFRDPATTPDEDIATPRLDWVIVGGESGKGARPMHPDWACDIRDQCAAAGVPFFFKQWGDWEIALDRDHDDPGWRLDYTNDYVDHGKSRWLNLEGGCGFHGERFHVMRKVGTKLAGRLLEGVEHNAMPEQT